MMCWNCGTYFPLDPFHEIEYCTVCESDLYYDDEMIEAEEL